MERSGMFSATYTSLSTVTKRNLKTNIQINPKPLHCTSMLLWVVPFHVSLIRETPFSDFYFLRLTCRLFINSSRSQVVPILLQRKVP